MNGDIPALPRSRGCGHDDATVEGDESRLASHLLLVRAFQWVHAAQGDPLAGALCDDDDAASRADAPNGMVKGSTGAWTITDYDQARRLLAGADVDLCHPESAGADPLLTHSSSAQRFCHVLDVGEPALKLRRKDYARLTAIAADVIDEQGWQAHPGELLQLFDHALGERDGDFDLIERLQPLVGAMTSRLIGLGGAEEKAFVALVPGLAPALDSGLCPPEHADAEMLLAALSSLRLLLTAAVDRRRRIPDLRSTVTGPTMLGQLLAREGADTQQCDDTLTLAVLSAVSVEISTTVLAGTVSRLLTGEGRQWRALSHRRHQAHDEVAATMQEAPVPRIISLIAQRDLDLPHARIHQNDQIVILPGRGLAAGALPEDLLRGFPITPMLPLVRLVAGIALQALAARYPELCVVRRPMRRRRAAVSGGVRSFRLATRV